MINLDALDADELQEAHLVFLKLAQFAQMSVIAREYRLAGLIEDATKAERACEDLYKQLPVWARW